jgi:hypothetical protein
MPGHAPVLFPVVDGLIVVGVDAEAVVAADRRWRRRKIKRDPWRRGEIKGDERINRS